VTNCEALQATKIALQSKGIYKKKEVRTVMVAKDPKASLTLNIPGIKQQNTNAQNLTPPQNTQNENPPPNPPAPHQYPTPL